MTMPLVMIVDDEAHVIRVLRLVLERAGYRVASAPNGQAALEALAASRPALLVTDIHMPLIDGRELCRVARARYPDEPFPILVMSALTAAGERDWARDLPNIEFLEKPVSPRQLAALAAARVPRPMEETPCTTKP